MFRHSGQGQIIAEVVAEIGAGVREGGVGGKAEAEGERILPGEFEPLDPAARSVRRLRHGPKPAAGLIVHENGDGFVDDEAVDLLPEQPGGEQPLISEIMLEAEVELIGAERVDRKSVGGGKGVSVRGDLGGRRIINKKNKTKKK